MIRAIPDEAVYPKPKPTRNGRRGPAPPPSPDVLGPVLRVVVLAAAMTVLRQFQEFLGHADSKTTQIYSHYAPS